MNENNHVVITDIRIPFLTLVLLMVKVAIASIPAMMIVGVLVSAVSAIVAVILGSVGSIVGP